MRNHLGNLIRHPLAGIFLNLILKEEKTEEAVDGN
jgi:hypothetical protein